MSVTPYKLFKRSFFFSTYNLINVSLEFFSISFGTKALCVDFSSPRVLCVVKIQRKLMLVYVCIVEKQAHQGLTKKKKQIPIKWCLSNSIYWNITGWMSTMILIGPVLLSFLTKLANDNQNQRTIIQTKEER